MGRAAVSKAIAILLATATLTGQPQAPRFEVASVRVIPDGGQFVLPTQRLTDTRADIQGGLNWILFSAFRAQYYEFQISAPSWLNEVRVEIHATLPAGATAAQVPEMLQQLLAERFGMVAHREMRQADGYELVVGPDGMKMLEVEPVDELRKEFPTELRGGRTLADYTRQTHDGPVRTMDLSKGGTRRITSRTMYERYISLGGDGSSVFNAIRMTMAELAPFLWEAMDAPVVDRTGLTGVYQFTLTLPRGAMGERHIRELASGRLGASLSSGAPTGGVSALKAIEGLGLKLERRRVPVEVVVVDRISRTPTDN